MVDMSAECKSLAYSLHTAAQSFSESPEQPPWTNIEASAQALANALRVKSGPDNHTALGKTTLPTDLNVLLTGFLAQPAYSSEASSAAFELLRIGANMCMDHGECVLFDGETLTTYWADANRELLLEAQFLHSVVSLLDRYADSIPPLGDPVKPLPLSIPQLKIVRTAIGVLLNATIGYEPVRTRLTALETATTILRLSTAIYSPGRWATEAGPLSPEDPTTDDALLDSWTIRSGLSNWSWRLLSELKGGDDSEDEPQVKSPNPQPLLGPDGLPLLIRQLTSFMPPYPEPQGPFADAATRRPLVAADADALEETCTLLEALCLDAEDIRLSFARGLSFPDGEHGGVRCIEELCAFLEHGDYPPYWQAEQLQERTRRQKVFDFCKAALVKALVEVAGEEKNTDVLWDDSESEKPGGPFVSTMVSWIRQHKKLGPQSRDDLVICATLCLGNLVRREAHSAAIVKPPIALAPDLAEMLLPETDLRVKHGIVGLLKHLAQSTANRAALGEAGLVEKLARSGIWSDKADMAEIIQVSAIGIVKHLCNSNVENTLALILPPEGEDADSTALQQIIALIRRSDSVPVKSEGTRVLVHAIKSVWSSDASAGARRQEAMITLLTPQTAEALAQLIGRSKKYPILINEGVIALTLLSTYMKGGTVVFDALTCPLPAEAGQRGASAPTSAGSTSSEASPVTGPPRVLDLLLSTLKNRDGRHVPELRANLCALLGQLGRSGVVDDREALGVSKMKAQAKPLLEAAAVTEKTNKGNIALATAAQRAIEAWA